MKVAEARDRFFDWIRPAKRSPHTLDAYRSDLDVIVALLGGWKALTVDDLTRERLLRAFAVYADGHAVATILRVHGTWSTFFDFLVAEGIREGSPMAAIPRPKRERRQPKPLIGWDEGIDYQLLRALKAGCRRGRYPWPELDVAVAATLFTTGLRAAELLALNIGSIEGRPPEQVVRVRGGKGKRDRAIAMGPELDELLGEYLDTRRERYPVWKPKPADPLFVAAKRNGKEGGTRMTYGQLEYLLETGLVSAGFGNRREAGTLAHAFRHTYGTVLARSGARVTDIRDLMGHSSLSTTQGYIDSVSRDQRESAMLSPAWEMLAKLNADESDRPSGS